MEKRSSRLDLSSSGRILTRRLQREASRPNTFPDSLPSAHQGGDGYRRLQAALHVAPELVRDVDDLRDVLSSLSGKEADVLVDRALGDLAWQIEHKLMSSTIASMWLRKMLVLVEGQVKRVEHDMGTSSLTATGNLRGSWQAELEDWCGLAAPDIAVKDALQQALSAQDARAQVWGGTCANLFLTSEGAFDPTVIPVLQRLLSAAQEGERQEDILPFETRDAVLLQLQRLMDPESKLPELIDQLSSTDPLDPSLRRLVRLQAGLGDACLRHKLASMVIMYLLTVPLQYNIGNCVLVSRNYVLQMQDPEFLLTHFVQWFSGGRIVVDRPDGGGDVMILEFHPMRAFSDAQRPCKGWTTIDEPPAGKWLQAMSRAFPDMDVEEHGRALKAAVRDLCRFHINPTPMQVIRHVLMTRYGLSESVLNRPFSLLGDRLKRSVLAFNQDVDDVLTAFQSTSVNLLTECWNMSYIAGYKENKLEMSWWSIESALRSSCGNAKVPAGWDEYLAEIRKQFLACASLHYEADLVDGEDAVPVDILGLRLHLKQAGAPGRGVPVNGSRDLSEWLSRISYDVSTQHPEGKFTVCRAFLSQQLSAHNLDRFLTAPDYVKSQPKTGQAQFVQPNVWRHPIGDIAPRHLTANIESAKPMRQLRPGQPGVGCSLELYTHAGGLQWHCKPSPKSAVPREALKGLLKMMCCMEQDCPGELDETLKRNHGLLPIVGHMGFFQRHGMNLLPNLPLFALARKLKPGEVDQWIDDTFEKPMRKAFRTQVNEAAARAWLTRVLSQCWLAKGVDESLVVQRIMKRVRTTSVNGEPHCAYKHLVEELERLLSSKTTPRVFAGKNAREVGLSVAVLNASPIAVPSMPYAHANWESAPLLAYAYDPVRKSLGHFKVQEKRGELSAPRLTFIDAFEPLLA